MKKFSPICLFIIFSFLPSLSNAFDKDQDPFAIAIKNKDAPAVRNLLNSGRSPNEFYDPSSKMDFMYMAIVSSNLEIVKMLEAAGGNLNTTKQSGLKFPDRPVCRAINFVHHGFNGLAIYLISKLENLNFYCNYSDGRLIDKAAIYCNSEILNVLLERGIKVDEDAVEGAIYKRPLLAIINPICGEKAWDTLGRDALTTLLRAGADPRKPVSKTNPDTAFSMSKRFPKMRKFLEEYLSSK